MSSKFVLIFLFVFNLYLYCDEQQYVENKKQEQETYIENQKNNLYEQNYFVQAAKHYQLNPKLLYAVAKTESGLKVNAINKANKNGSTDIGIMQINTIHLPFLKKHNIEREDLFDPRVNIFIGAWVLKNCVNKHGMNYKALNCYNGRIINNDYYQRVLKNYNQIK